ncbi:MAG: cAMP/cGMP-dependent 3',5'-cyclic-AMP/GMP phosphodiesterase [Candidatus Hydrogenedentota bacterium]|nr:MAG: cAMP/cGMP-dependent 3',5'-cyclic-AMP/GMP phosphodiesterase [Candidatus Hydrogenedentota bacterium]
MTGQTQTKPVMETLPRGGYLVRTSAGNIQFGAPPETIKDTMVTEESVPQIFVLPGQMFSVEKGIAVAELEFPIYFNHFLCQKKTLIIGTIEQERRLRQVLQESVFGPETINLESEFLNGKKNPEFPDMKAEMNYFRGNRQLEDLVQFGNFKNNVYQLENVEIKRNPGRNFEVKDHGKKIATIPWEIEFHIKYDIGSRLAEPYDPPEFGITCLGPSHGFDPNDNTSGFILWVNHRGIMIDPPVNSTEWLRESNVNPKLISSVILTHCHADHDAGTFQKILEESQIQIYTTEPVMDSCIRKYMALTGLPRQQLYSLFEFQPVTVGKPMFIEGAEFIFHYALHSIPSLGFRMHYLNQSFFYTSDHLNHPESIDKMYKEGVFPEGRYRFLKNFPWHYKNIYHEAGIPPLHTPVSYLASLPEDVQKRITVYHIAKKDFPKDSHLSLAKFGIENTNYPKIEHPPYAEAIRILDVMNHVDLFAEMSAIKAKEFLTIVREEEFKRGEKIITKGTPGDKFYIIVSGNVVVEGLDNNFKKTYGMYEYFGEASIVTGQLRSADVVAETDVIALTMEKNAFLNFIEGTPLQQYLKQLAEVRSSQTWDLLSMSPVFHAMTSHQKTQLEAIMHKVQLPAKTKIMDAKKPHLKAYIVVDSEVKLLRENKVLKKLQKGDFVCDVFSLQKKAPPPFDAITTHDGVFYEIESEDLTRFIQNNPGIYMRLMRAHEDITN